MRELLYVDGLTYTYPGSHSPALNGLGLAFPQGKKSVLLGRNGCGKSTLFLHANGLCKPHKGTVCWRGEPLRYDRRSLRALRQQVGLVLQDPEQQLVASTVEEDLSYGLCNQGLEEAEIRQRVELALERFRLRELARTPLHTLSLGQKKRVSLAGVMVLKPELLLLDEPTAYLDPGETENMLAALADIHRSGTTIVMATHDLDLAWSWADQVFVLDQGRLALAGEPQDVFLPRHEEQLRGLGLGLPQMVKLWNALPAQAKPQEAPVPRSLEEWTKRLSHETSV